MMGPGNYDTVCSMLRHMIDTSGLTYRDLGPRLGLSITSLSFIVSGRRFPTRDTIIALAYECSCDREALNRVLLAAGYDVLMGQGPASLPMPPFHAATNR